MITKVMNYLQTASTQMAGQINRLNDILYAGLVTGFNSKNVSSIVVSMNIATVTTSTDHGYNVNDCVKIEGANESILNDDFFVTPTSTTTFTFPLTSSDFAGTGTITVKIAPLGWERVYTGTNKAVYRAPEGNRLYLRVDDSNAQYALVNAYETMSDVDTGTNGTTAVYWKKSDATSSATREWYLFGNRKTFYLFVAWASSSYLTWHIGYAFGEMKSLKAGDNWNTILIGYTSNPTSLWSSTSFYNTSGAAAAGGQYLMRRSIGTAGVITFYKISASLNTYSGYSGGFSYPNPTNNGMELVPAEVIETGNVYRGRLYGLLNTMEVIPGATFNSGDRTVVIDGRPFMAMKVSISGTAYNLWVDIGEWE